MTLVEVLIALVLFAVGLAGTLDLLFNLTNSLPANRRETQARYLVQDRLANLEMAGYAALDDQIRTLAKPSDAGEAALFQSMVLNPNFTLKTQLRREETEGVRRIMITVSGEWSEQRATKARKAVGYVFAP